MNKIIKLFFFGLLCVGMFSCKNNTPETKEVKENEPKEIKVSTPSSELKVIRDKAISIYEYRMNNIKPTIGQLLDNGLWEFKFTFEDGEMTKPGELAGNWIDFDEFNKYTYGNYGEVKGDGVYHFDTENMKLLMVDNNELVKPEEHILKIVNGAMIMQGQKTFGGNSKQSKLDWMEERPAK